ncbi:MAG: hypothetical protein Tsb002_21210 [Wenzhouxiangellaceae bacterium]
MNNGTGISVQQIDMQLPPGYGRRADRIVRLAMHELARLPLALDSEVRLQRLALPPLSVRPGDSDLTLARRIASAIVERLRADLRQARQQHGGGQ